MGATSAAPSAGIGSKYLRKPSGRTQPIVPRAVELRHTASATNRPRGHKNPRRRWIMPAPPGQARPDSGRRTWSTKPNHWRLDPLPGTWSTKPNRSSLGPQRWTLPTDRNSPRGTPRGERIQGNPDHPQIRAHRADHPATHRTPAKGAGSDWQYRDTGAEDRPTVLCRVAREWPAEVESLHQAEGRGTVPRDRGQSGA